MKRICALRPFLLSVSLGALSLLPLCGHSADHPRLTLAEVLASYRKATAPPPGQPAVTSWRTVGTIDSGGLHGQYVRVYKDPDKYWEENKIGIFDTVSGSDGKVSWERDTNGNVRLESQEEEKDDTTDAAISSHAFADTDGFDGKVTLRPETEPRTGCYILDVTPVDGKPTALFLDPKTFFLMKEERLDDNRTTTSTYSDFRMLGGRMRAATRHIHSGARKYDETITISAMNDDGAVADTLFALPATTNNYTWVTPGATSADLPFDYSDKSVALYSAINGRPTYLELDSGAGGIAISQIAADQLHLSHVGTFEGHGYGGTIDINPVKLDTFELVGGVVFSNLSASSLKLFEQYAYYQAVPTIGLMGYDLLVALCGTGQLRNADTDTHRSEDVPAGGHRRHDACAGFEWQHAQCFGIV